jgi:hypothetical protein
MDTLMGDERTQLIFTDPPALWYKEAEWQIARRVNHRSGSRSMAPSQQNFAMGGLVTSSNHPGGSEISRQTNRKSFTLLVMSWAAVTLLNVIVSAPAVITAPEALSVSAA